MEPELILRLYLLLPHNNSGSFPASTMTFHLPKGLVWGLDPQEPTRGLHVTIAGGSWLGYVGGPVTSSSPMDTTPRSGGPSNDNPGKVRKFVCLFFEHFKGVFRIPFSPSSHELPRCASLRTLIFPQAPSGWWLRRHIFLSGAQSKLSRISGEPHF